VANNANLSELSILYSQNYPTHTKYSSNIFRWLSSRDAIEGEAQIKFKNELYLPIPSAMRDIPGPSATAQSNAYYSQLYASDLLKTLQSQYNPNYHPNEAYRAYLTRAQFPEIPAYVLRGLIGLALTSLPEVKLPKELEYLEENATLSGLSMVEFYIYLLREVITTGRIPLTFDYDEATDRFHFITYTAETSLNWAQDKYGKLSGTRFVENESFGMVEQPAFSFGNTDKTIIEQFIDQDNKYSTRVIKNPEGQDEAILTNVTSFMGKTLDYIPTVFIGSLNNTPDVDPSPLFPIASTALSIYRKSADLAQSEFMSCSPMLVISGMDADTAPSAIGSSVALILSNPDAKAYYTKTDTSALSHMKNQIDDLSNHALSLGTQLLDTAHRPAETPETVRLKQAASASTLVSMVRSIAMGINSTIKSMTEILSKEISEVPFTPDTKFIAPATTAAEIRELVQSWINGAISHKTLLRNFHKASILDENTLPEDELENIKNEPIIPGTPKAARYEAFAAQGRGKLGTTTAETKTLGVSQSENDQPDTIKRGT